MDLKSLTKRAALTILMSMLCLVAFAQNRQVSGIIKDASGEPMIGVNVLVKGTTNGTISDFDGKFVLSGVADKSVLVISYIGYKTQEVPVGNKSSFSIVMEDDTETLDEVVVVGYGQMKKSDLTGSVSSISAETLTAKGTTSALEALQGSVPGASITQNGGRSQAGFDIQIRGKSSINGDVTPLYVVDGIICSDIDFLNPQDIERIDILKDASSTAIYGSRATAGVVVVTTKSGATVSKKNLSKANVTYDGYYGISQVARMPDFMDGPAFAQWRFMQFLSSENMNAANPVYRMVGGANYAQGMIFDDNGNSVIKQALATGKYYDWPDMVTQNGQEQNHYLAVSGSSDKVNYHLGMGYNSNEGIYDGDDQKRFNIKGSVDTKVNKYFSAGISFNLAYIDEDFASDEGIKYAYRQVPFAVPYNANGEMNDKPGNFEALGSNSSNQFTDTYNPLGYLQDDVKQQKTYRALGNIYLALTPVKGLTLKTTFSPNYTRVRTGEFTGSFASRVPTANTTSTDAMDWTWDNQIDYNFTKNDHSFNAMALFSMNSYNYEKYYQEVTNPTDGTLWYNLGTGTMQEYTSEYQENSLISYALRLNYSYKGKYMITGTVRTDGSSKFADGHRWGWFPSIAAAWRLSEESWLKTDWLDNLKLRLSYGVTGNNSGIGNYATMTTGSGPNYYAFGNALANGYYPSGVVNRALSWETSNEVNLGLDFGFLGNRINGSVDFYNKLSKDLLYERELPLVSGGGSLYDNVGEVRNRGVEIALNTVNVQTKDWRWETTFSFAYNKNKVMEINGTSDQIINGGDGYDPILKSLFVGQPVNNVYTYNWSGMVTDRNISIPNNKAGQAYAAANGMKVGDAVKSCDYYYNVYGWQEGMPIIEDVNGDGVIDADNDRKVLGSRDAAWTGSITSNLSYKNWDLSISVYTKQNYKVYSAFLHENYDYAYRGWNNLDMDYYIPAGTLIGCDGVNDNGSYINPVYQENTHYGKYPFPNASVTNNGVGSQFYVKEKMNLAAVTDASYWKIRNIVLGYTFPKKWMNKIKVQNLRLYVNVTNPFVFSKYKGFDPEWAGTEMKNDGPSTVTYQFGINLKF